jgi:hypothetical protein
MAEWLPWISHLQPPGVDRIQFHRFSPYHFRAESFGLSLTPYPFYSYIYPLPPEDLKELAYYFQDAARRPAREELASRPHLKRVIAVLGAWRALWGQDGHRQDGPVPLLLIEVEEPDRLRIRDTRPCAVAPVHILEGPACQVYRACGQVQSLASLGSLCPGMSDADLEAAVAELVDRRLLLHRKGKLLALALTQVERIPDSLEEFPAGYVDQEAWQRHQPAHAAAP